MELIFKCRKCDSEQLNVSHEWDEVENGNLFLCCGCGDYEGILPKTMVEQARQRTAAEVDYTEERQCYQEDHFDGMDWHPDERPYQGDGCSEFSYGDMVVRCSACHEDNHFPNDYETADGPEVEVDENSHKFKVSCANCHAPIECVGAIEEFVRGALIE